MAKLASYDKGCATRCLQQAMQFYHSNNIATFESSLLLQDGRAMCAGEPLRFQTTYHFRPFCAVVKFSRANIIAALAINSNKH